jgi:hypothetical protein
VTSEPARRARAQPALRNSLRATTYAAQQPAPLINYALCRSTCESIPSSASSPSGMAASAVSQCSDGKLSSPSTTSRPHQPLTNRARMASCSSQPFCSTSAPVLSSASKPSAMKPLTPMRDRLEHAHPAVDAEAQLLQLRRQQISSLGRRLRSAQGLRAQPLQALQLRQTSHVEHAVYMYVREGSVWRPGA